MLTVEEARIEKAKLVAEAAVLYPSLSEQTLRQFSMEGLIRMIENARRRPRA